MAQKELTIKVNIEGQEVVMTGKQIELLKSNIVDLKTKLAELGERTEENGEIFDKLRGDIQALEQAFGEVKDETKESGDSMQEFGDKSEKSGEKTKSLRAELSKARNDLAALGERTAENAVRFDELTSRVQTLSEKYEDVQFGTKKLDDALAALPGPIGQAAQGFKVFDDGLKNARSAMGSLTRTFPILKNAIAATGIGALVILFGLLVAAVMKAFNSFKPLQQAVDKLGIAFDLVMKLVEPLIELIGKGLTVVLEGLAKTLAFVTGNMEEYNKAAADKAATEALEKNLQKQKDLLDANGYKYDEFTKRKIQANIDYNEKKLELDKDETRSEAEKQALLKQYRDKADYEIAQADKDRQTKADEAAKKEQERIKSENQKKADKAKEAAQKAADIEKDFQSRLKSIRDENTLLAIEDEAERGRKQLEIQRDTQLAEINALQVTEKKKQQLRDETLKNYGLKLKQFNDNIIAQEKKANEDIAKQVRDIRTSMIEDENERMKAEAENRRDDALAAVEQTKATEEAKAAARKAINEKYAKDVIDIEKGITKKSAEEVFRQIEFERESRNIALQNRLKEIELGTEREIAKVEARRMVLQEQAQIDFDAEMSNLKKLLDSQQITKAEYEEREKERKRQFELTLTQIELDNVANRQQARQSEIASYAELANSVLGLISVFQKQGQESEALVKIQQALTLATNIATLVNNVNALSELAKAYGKQIGKASALPFPASIGAIVAVIGSFVSVLATGKQLFGIGKGGGGASASGGGSASVANLGRNYADGGLIGGRRHAQGGTLIEAEAGEAIMTRGAVTMFAPVLSAMNQMGGGTAFNRNALMTSYDAPVVEKPVQAQEPVIMKTYVVSNELTTEAERQARLKDLSTL